MVDFAGLLDTKYAILAKQADAAKTEADARAALQYAQADAIARSTPADNALKKAQAAAVSAGVDQAQISGFSENALRAAQARNLDATANSTNLESGPGGGLLGFLQSLGGGAPAGGVAPAGGAPSAGKTTLSGGAPTTSIQNSLSVNSDPVDLAAARARRASLYGI